MFNPMHNQRLRLALGAFRTSVASIYVEVDKPVLYSRRKNSLFKMLYDLLLTHQILLMKFHFQQNMLIYMNRSVNLATKH